MKLVKASVKGLLFCYLVLFVTPTSAAAVQQEDVEPMVAMFGPAQSKPGDVIQGKIGIAHLIYHLPKQSPEQPFLIVKLTKDGVDSAAIAEVYDVPFGEEHVPLEFVNGLPVLPDDLQPVISLAAPDGWWMRDGIVNYNLDVTVYGQVAAMWGATPDARAGPQANWPQLLNPDDPNARIVVRDTDGDGLPDWDWRTMLPEFPNRGDYRTNYAEKKCATPVEIDPGVSPEWPFVALDGGFEQEPGKFRSPIVVDWETGRVQYFSELITVRHQNCSYSLYSISRVEPGKLNSPNFETPFAFYDLSGEGAGYPNLLLRTQRTVEDDLYLFLDDNPETQSIRYSWRNQVGDGRWDYKVEVLGQHRYSARTPIAGGAALIDAPAYEAFPSWVVEREWPVAVFIGAGEGGSYRSSEGIYEWSPLGLSQEYFFGWQVEPDLSQFTDIRAGLRGEVRLRTTRPASLYFSPIDNRLHLKWAERGIWRLDEEQIIRVENLDGDETIDLWSREALPVTVEEDAQEDESRPQASDDAGTAAQPPDEVPVTGEGSADVIEVLYALDGYLLHGDQSGVTLVAADYEAVLFETVPPTDHATWESHRARLAPYEERGRDPSDLRSWLDALPGTRSEISGASLANVRMTGEGFRFELSLEPGYRLDGANVVGLAGLTAGDYLVEHEGGAFAVVPLVPPQLTLEVRRLDEGQHPAAAQVSVHNAGTADAAGLTLVAEVENEDGEVVEFARRPVDALAGETHRLLLDVAAPAGSGTLRVRLEDTEGQVVATAGPAGLVIPPIDRDSVLGIWKLPALAPVAALFGALLAAAAVLAVARRRGEVAP